MSVLLLGSYGRLFIGLKLLHCCAVYGSGRCGLLLIRAGWLGDTNCWLYCRRDFVR